MNPKVFSRKYCILSSNMRRGRFLPLINFSKKMFLLSGIISMFKKWNLCVFFDFYILLNNLLRKHTHIYVWIIPNPIAVISNEKQRFFKYSHTELPTNGKTSETKFIEVFSYNQWFPSFKNKIFSLANHYWVVFLTLHKDLMILRKKDEWK